MSFISASGNISRLPCRTDSSQADGTWVPYPSHLLPDSETGSFTPLLKGYFRPRTRIEAYAKGVGISGWLIDQAGAPLAGRKIALEGIDKEGAGTLSGVSLSGTVPRAARQAVLGLRINAECNCSGSVDISIGIVHYREGGGAEYWLTPAATARFGKTQLTGRRRSGRSRRFGSLRRPAG